MIDIDLTALTDEEINDLLGRVAAEQSRRRTLMEIPTRIEALNVEYLTTAGIEPGDPWVQPRGAHDAYPAGWLVEHDGAAWVSLVAGNVWEPGVSGWREEDGSDGPAEFVQPTGAHDAYGIGDRVTFEGQVWESSIAGNIWSPTAYPPGWTLITG